MELYLDSQFVYLMLVLYCLDSCSFVVCFKIGKYESSNFVLFQGYLAILVSLHFYINVRTVCHMPMLELIDLGDEELWASLGLWS